MNGFGGAYGNYGAGNYGATPYAGFGSSGAASPGFGLAPQISQAQIAGAGGSPIVGNAPGGAPGSVIGVQPSTNPLDQTGTYLGSTGYGTGGRSVWPRVTPNPFDQYAPQCRQRPLNNGSRSRTSSTSSTSRPARFSSTPRSTRSISPATFRSALNRSFRKPTPQPASPAGGRRTSTHRDGLRRCRTHAFRRRHGRSEPPVTRSAAGQRVEFEGQGALRTEYRCHRQHPGIDHGRQFRTHALFRVGQQRPPGQRHYAVPPIRPPTPAPASDSPSSRASIRAASSLW